MNEQETAELEHNINSIMVAITTLQANRDNIGYQLAELKRTVESLINLLPPARQAEYKRQFSQSH